MATDQTKTGDESATKCYVCERPTPEATIYTGGKDWDIPNVIGVCPNHVGDVIGDLVGQHTVEFADGRGIDQ